MKCQNCGREAVEPPRVQGTPKKRFCSQHCRTEWHNDRRRADARGTEGSDRASRRNQAKRWGYVWEALERRELLTGQIAVLLPMRP